MESFYKKLVTVCIPTFNGEKFLLEALDSVKNQTFNNIEVIISDDNSTDRTLEISKRFMEEIDIPVLIFNHEPAGIGANWNNCLKEARGDYIKFLFQDDILFPTCIEKMVEIAEQNQKIGLVSCKRKFLIEGRQNYDLKKWISKYEDLQRDLTLSEDNIYYVSKEMFRSEKFLMSPLNKIGEPTCVLFRKSLINRIGDFREDLEQILDYEFYHRILKIKNIAIINEELAGFRIHEKQATNVNRYRKINDYAIYDRILYDNFLWYLSNNQKKRLLLKFNRTFRFFNKVFKIAKKRF